MRSIKSVHMVSLAVALSIMQIISTSSAISQANSNDSSDEEKTANFGANTLLPSILDKAANLRPSPVHIEKPPNKTEKGITKSKTFSKVTVKPPVESVLQNHKTFEPNNINQHYAHKLEYITIGSSKDDVLSVQGTPTAISNNTFHYGLSEIYFNGDKVCSWQAYATDPLKVQLLPAKNSNQSYITIGSSKDDVLSIQGTPTAISNNTFHYGLSEIYFNGDKVSSWQAFATDPLKVQLLPAKNSNQSYITIGSSKDDVLSIQGTPTAISNNTFHYGLSEIYFNGDKVSSWQAFATDPLKVQLLPAKNSNQSYITIGSSKDDVLSIQGTPTAISNNTFHYGLSEIYFNGDKVSSWQAFATDPLKVQLLPPKPDVTTQEDAINSDENNRIKGESEKPADSYQSSKHDELTNNANSDLTPTQIADLKAQANNLQNTEKENSLVLGQKAGQISIQQAPPEQQKPPSEPTEKQQNKHPEKKALSPLENFMALLLAGLALFLPVSFCVLVAVFSLASFLKWLKQQAKNALSKKRINSDPFPTTTVASSTIKSSLGCIGLNKEAVKAIRQGNYLTAIQKLEEAIADDPTYMLAYRNLGMAYNNWGIHWSDPHQAIPRFYRALLLNAGDEKILGNLDNVLKKIGKNSESFIDHIELAEQMISTEDYFGAVSAYTQGLAIQEDNYIRTKFDDTLKRARSDPKWKIYLAKQATQQPLKTNIVHQKSLSTLPELNESSQSATLSEQNFDGDGFEDPDPKVAKSLELKAMQIVMDYEKNSGRLPKDVSMYNVGYDIESWHGETFRAIEVKAKATEGAVIVTANEWKTASKLGNQYYLYVVSNISKEPQPPKIIQNPYFRLKAEALRFAYIFRREDYLRTAKVIEARPKN